MKIENESDLDDWLVSESTKTYIGDNIELRSLINKKHTDYMPIFYEVEDVFDKYIIPMYEEVQVLVDYAHDLKLSNDIYDIDRFFGAYLMKVSIDLSGTNIMKDVFKYEIYPTNSKIDHIKMRTKFNKNKYIIDLLVDDILCKRIIYMIKSDVVQTKYSILYLNDDNSRKLMDIISRFSPTNIKGTYTKLHTKLLLS